MIEARRILLRTQVSTLLPREARAALREASEVESHMPRCSSMARTEAVNAAVERVRRAYPEYFRPEALTQTVT